MLGKYIIVFLLSMVPFVEINGAFKISQTFGLIDFVSIILCILGNIIPTGIVYLFTRKILEIGKDVKFIGKYINWILLKGGRFGKKITKKIGNGIYWVLFLFVLIPLPGFGVWIASLTGAILDLDFKKIISACIAGIFAYGIVALVLSSGLLEVIF